MIYEVEYKDEKVVLEFEIDSLYPNGDPRLRERIKEHAKEFGGCPKTWYYLSTKPITPDKSPQLRFEFRS